MAVAKAKTARTKAKVARTKAKVARTKAKTRSAKEDPALGFAYAPMPDDYPGNKVWWTIRFVGPAPAPELLPGWERYDMTCEGASGGEWVDPAVLAIGDEVFGGRIVAIIDVAGKPALKVQLRHGTQIVPLWTLDEKVERRSRGRAASRHLEVSYEGSIDGFEEWKARTFFAGVHAKFPLVAVVFQEGQFAAGASLLALDDAALLARLRAG